MHRSTFYAWYRRYVEDGYDGLGDHKPHFTRKSWRIKSLIMF
ncbi:hypothetical protein ACFL5H_03140 [Candidatus Latescibacterota bacterium]